MRKLIVFMVSSLDGFYAGENGELDWHNVDSEFNKFAEDQLNSTDLLIFGRKTYDLMANYWPTSNAKKDDPTIAKIMNEKSKIVISTTINNPKWENTKLIKENIEKEIKKLKNQKGKDIFIFGSSTLCANLINLDLIDEYRIMINPIMLGKGKSLFNGIINRINLNLIKSKNFDSGNVLLYYKNKK